MSIGASLLQRQTIHAVASFFWNRDLSFHPWERSSLSKTRQILEPVGRAGETQAVTGPILPYA